MIVSDAIGALALSDHGQHPFTLARTRQTLQTSIDTTLDE